MLNSSWPAWALLLAAHFSLSLSPWPPDALPGLSSSWLALLSLSLYPYALGPGGSDRVNREREKVSLVRSMYLFCQQLNDAQLEIRTITYVQLAHI